MAQANNKIYLKTGIVLSRFTKINGNVDTYTDPRTGVTKEIGYSISVELTEEQYEELRNQMIAVWENSPEYQETINSGKSGKEPSLGLKKFKDKEGNWHLQFKAKTVKEFYNRDTGIATPNTIKIYDGLNNQLPSDTVITYNSKVVVNFWAKPFISPLMYGISPKLAQIQVIELAGGTTGASPFDVVEGSHALNSNATELKANTVESDEIPF